MLTADLRYVRACSRLHVHNSYMPAVKVHRHKDGSADYSVFYSSASSREAGGAIQTNLFSASDPVALAVTHSADLVKWESSDERESSWHLPATPWRFSSWVPVGSVGVSVNHNSAASFVKGLVCSSFECSTKQLSLRWFELTRGPSSVY